ncbi:MAG: epoxyqueuosine reductase QueH [Nitrospirota bacterium]
MKILLHICCSNCAISPVRILRAEKHDIAGFWFNPNIHPYEEYDLRLESLKKLADQWKLDVCFTENYTPEEYFGMFNISVTALNGLSGSNNPPFPDRCKSCYKLRLEKTAEHARKEGFDAFSTTLLISPYQDFQQIVSTGMELAEKYSVQFHIKDYRPHFREAMALAKDMGLYRQKYCGCIFSREERKVKAK